MIDKTNIVKTLQLENMTHDDQMEVLNSIEQTIKESRAKQKEQLKSNVDFVVEALRNIKSDLEDKFSKLDSKLETKVEKIIKGRDGAPGKDGLPGKEGPAGKEGKPGTPGKDGKDGKEGVGVSKAKVDIDGMLVITLTDGKVIEAGKVFTKAVAEKIRVFSNSDNRVPELVGQSGKILSNDGTNLTWIAQPSTTGTVTSVAMTTPTGLSVTGSPITTSGTLALSLTSGYSIPTTTKQTNWDTAYSERNQWDGGATGLVAATGRTSLGLGTMATANTSSYSTTGTDTTYAYRANNLSDLANAATARTNLGVTATGSDTTYAYRANNLSDLASASTARTNLGLGTAATMTGPAGTIVGTSDTQTLTNKTLTNPTITNYTETLYTANTGASITVDLANGTVQLLTLNSASVTITTPTAAAGKSFVIMLKQDGTGGRTVTWTTVKWAGGTAPTITSTASKMDIFSFFSDGTNWYGVVVGQNYTP